MGKRLVRTAGTGILALSLGCAGTSVQTYTKPPTEQVRYGKVKKVAILRFDSVVEGAQASRIVEDLFLQELLARGTFEAIEEPRYVAELMKKLKLRNTENLDRETVRKIGEELEAQALILGQLLLFGQEENSEIVEFALQTNMVDAETGDILWSGRSFGNSSTSLGEILGVNQGPSVNALAKSAVATLVSRLNREFSRARKAEDKQVRKAAKAAARAKTDASSAEVGASPGNDETAALEEAEEILLQVKPK